MDQFSDFSMIVNWISLGFETVWRSHWTLGSCYGHFSLNRPPINWLIAIINNFKLMLQCGTWSVSHHLTSAEVNKRLWTSFGTCQRSHPGVFLFCLSSCWTYSLMLCTEICLLLLGHILGLSKRKYCQMYSASKMQSEF